MKQIMYALTTICIFSATVFSQHPYEISGEYQHGIGKQYHSNSIGVKYEGFNNNNSRNLNKSNQGSWSLGVNYSFSSMGKGKETAKGHGIGILAGYRYGLKYGLSGNLFGGIRTTFTFGKNDPENKYSTFTPSLEFGYHYTAQDFGKGGAFTPFVAFGYDFKIAADEKTKGVHERAFFSPGVSIGYRF
jgi:hypothetical protein